jgi:hypothetical protein
LENIGDRRRLQNPGEGGTRRQERRKKKKFFFLLNFIETKSVADVMLLFLLLPFSHLRLK